MDGLDFLFGFFSFCDDLLGFDGISLLDEDVHLDISCIVFTDLLSESFESDLELISFFLDTRDLRIEWSNLSKVFRIACLKELFDS